MEHSRRIGVVLVGVVWWMVAGPILSQALVAGESAQRAAVLASGVLQPADDQVVRSQVGGPATIVSVAAEGTVVKKGDLLVELDAPGLIEESEQQGVLAAEAQAQLTAAEAALPAARDESREAVQVAEEALNLAQRALRMCTEMEHPLQEASAENEVVLARERRAMALARLSYLERATDADAEGELAPMEAKLMLLEAELQLKETEDRLLLVKEVFHPEKKLQLQLAVSQRKLELVHARNQASKLARQAQVTLAAARARYEMERRRSDRLDDRIAACKIHAPREGTVLYSRDAWGGGTSDATIEAGVVVGHRQPVVSVADTARFKLDVPVGLDAVQRVEEGQKVSIRFDALPRQSFPGTIVAARVLPHAPRDSPSGRVTVGLADPAKRLRPGMFAIVEFELGKTTGHGEASVGDLN